jgi:AIPR protein
MIDLDYPALLGLFPQHVAPKRSESASFLIWYLENYYRLDGVEAVDSVCDQKGDKGVDGIFVNDNDQTITIFQSRISQSSKTTIGDTSLKEFAGTITQFQDAGTISHLIATAGNAQVAALAKRLDLVNKIATHELRGEFVTNIDIDQNGLSFLKHNPHIAFVGKKTLVSTYISEQRDLPMHGPMKFDIVGFPVSEYIVDANAKAVIAPIKATELVAMEGIGDQSLFAYNVRGPLGKTQVNKDIVKSLKDSRSHKLFPLFHNGITVIAGNLQTDAQTLTASDYFVVNGCQSLTAMYNNSENLTDNLRVLTKFIKMDPRSPSAKMITEFSNNQNSVKPRDFKANNQIQIRLQNEFTRHYAGQFELEIKRGEALGPGNVISNEIAGLYLMAFDLKEPWATHRKYQVFEDKHADIFGRPEVNADRVVMCQAIMDAIESHIFDIHNKLFGRYILTQYLLMFIVREIFDNDEFAQEILARPEKFVRDKDSRSRFYNCVKALMGDIIVDLNAEVDEFGDDFDYRDKLRDSEWVKSLSKKIVADHLKQIKRARIPSLKQEWDRLDGNQEAEAGH